jgi:hypothetical protein
MDIILTLFLFLLFSPPYRLVSCQAQFYCQEYPPRPGQGGGRLAAAHSPQGLPRQDEREGQTHFFARANGPYRVNRRILCHVQVPSLAPPKVNEGAAAQAAQYWGMKRAPPVATALTNQNIKSCRDLSFPVDEVNGDVERMVGPTLLTALYRYSREGREGRGQGKTATEGWRPTRRTTKQRWTSWRSPLPACLLAPPRIGREQRRSTRCDFVSKGRGGSSGREEGEE